MPSAKCWKLDVVFRSVRMYSMLVDSDTVVAEGGIENNGRKMGPERQEPATAKFSWGLLGGCGTREGRGGPGSAG